MRLLILVAGLLLTTGVYGSTDSRVLPRYLSMVSSADSPECFYQFERGLVTGKVGPEIYEVAFHVRDMSITITAHIDCLRVGSTLPDHISIRDYLRGKGDR